MAKKIIKILVNTFKTVLSVIIVLFVGFVLLQRFSNNNITVLGYRLFAVVTGSMEPVYNIGDVLLCKTVDTDKLKVGDDITYLGKEASFKDKVITHRIEKIEKKDGKKIFFTKGVASNSIDPPIEANQIYGTVSRKLTILSFFHKYSSGSMGFFFFIVIPIMLLVGTEIVQSMIEKYEKKNPQLIDKNNIEQNKDNENQIKTQPTEQELQQELQALKQQVTEQQQVQTQPTEQELQQELQALKQQVAEQQQVGTQPTEAELQQELQALQEQVAHQQQQTQ